MCFGSTAVPMWTAKSTRLQTFCSQFFHSQAWAVDALKQDLVGIKGYAFHCGPNLVRTDKAERLTLDSNSNSSVLA